MRKALHASHKTDDPVPPSCTQFLICGNHKTDKYTRFCVYASSFPLSFALFPPLSLPVLLAAIRPTFLPAGVFLLTVEGLPMC